MLLNLETDYAVRIIHVLSLFDKRIDAASVSEYSNVSLRFSLKILNKLVLGGLVKSYKGSKGGYELAKSAAEISVLNVFEVINGPLFISRCQSEYVCERKKYDDLCMFRAVFDDAAEYITDKFSAKTFYLDDETKEHMREHIKDCCNCNKKESKV